MGKKHMVAATFPACSQVILLNKSVLDHFAAHRQTGLRKREAGGQLFAKLDVGMLKIEVATGPYRSDHRSRFSYRSDPGLAQREIIKKKKSGLYYCGDWHTHPEDRPLASREDLRTIATLASRSDLRLNCVVMIIQGVLQGAEGLAVYSSNGVAVDRWTVLGGGFL
jgi:hypothetical protein